MVGRVLNAMGGLQSRVMFFSIRNVKATQRTMDVFRDATISWRPMHAAGKANLEASVVNDSPVIRSNDICCER